MPHSTVAVFMHAPNSAMCYSDRYLASLVVPVLSRVRLLQRLEELAVGADLDGVATGVLGL